MDASIPISTGSAYTIETTTSCLPLACSTTINFVDCLHSPSSSLRHSTLKYDTSTRRLIQRYLTQVSSDLGENHMREVPHVQLWDERQCGNTGIESSMSARVPRVFRRGAPSSAGMCQSNKLPLSLLFK